MWMGLVGVGGMGVGGVGGCGWVWVGVGGMRQRRNKS